MIILEWKQEDSKILGITQQHFETTYNSVKIYTLYTSDKQKYTPLKINNQIGPRKKQNTYLKRKNALNQKSSITHQLILAKENEQKQNSNSAGNDENNTA